MSAEMNPKEKVRVKIDKMLEAAGWRVVSRDEFVPDEALAVKEGLMQGYCPKKCVKIVCAKIYFF